MYGKWDLTKEEKEYFTLLLSYGIQQLQLGRTDEFDLTNKGISPWQAKELLETMGYEFIDFQDNGWEQDRNYYFKGLRLSSCGATFELALYLDDEEE